MQHGKTLSTGGSGGKASLLVATKVLKLVRLGLDWFQYFLTYTILKNTKIESGTFLATFLSKYKYKFVVKIMPETVNCVNSLLDSMSTRGGYTPPEPIFFLYPFKPYFFRCFF